jgi:hypothetical protein
MTSETRDIERATVGASRHRVIAEMESGLCELVAHGLQACHRHRDRIAVSVHRGGDSIRAYCATCEQDACLDEEVARQKRLRQSMRSRS